MTVLGSVSPMIVSLLGPKPFFLFSTVFSSHMTSLLMINLVAPPTLTDRPLSIDGCIALSGVMSWKSELSFTDRLRVIQSLLV